VEASARHGIAVCDARGSGCSRRWSCWCARSAAADGTPASSCSSSSRFTVLYRVLFLLFAEARGLVPVWHPSTATGTPSNRLSRRCWPDRRYRGVWNAINAISRLAHAGCTAGELKVTAFNGRLFSPSGTGTFGREPIDDGVMAKAVLSISTHAADRSAGRQRIVYRDLDVEELGAVYEQGARLRAGRRGADRTRDLRKSTGGVLHAASA
jgi:hypothetical protein